MTTGAKNPGNAARISMLLLLDIVGSLASDKPLPRWNFDHAWSGKWNDHRDCHVRPDLVLIYRKPDHLSLELVRLGSHSELGR